LFVELHLDNSILSAAVLNCIGRPAIKLKKMLLFANVLAPHFGIFADVFAEQRGALRRVEIKDADPKGAEQLDSALKGATLSDD
jgi:hypothetical protein